MKKLTVTDEKIFRVWKAFDRKNIKQSCGFEKFPRTVFGKDCQYREEDSEKKFCHKKSTLPVKKSR